MANNRRPGSIVRTQQEKNNEVVSVKDFGAVGDGEHDDTSSLQAAIDACRSPFTGSAFGSQCSVRVTAGRYRITAQLNMYSPANPAGEYEGAQLIGDGKETTVIEYRGPASTSALRMIGAFQKVSDLAIVNRGSAGWKAAISYDGDVQIGRSSVSKVADVYINCNNLPGSGILVGAAAHQADQLSIDHPTIANCKHGYGIATQDPNAVAIYASNASIWNCWIGVFAHTSSNIVIAGGELDTNDVNFMPLPGSHCQVSGVRSEHSKRTVFTASGAYPVAFMLQSYMMADRNVARPSASVLSVRQRDISFSADGFTFGDRIIIRRDGQPDLHTRIVAMADLRHVTVSDSISPAVAGGTAVLDSSVQQDDLEENGGGPFVHIGNTWNFPATASLPSRSGTQIFIGNSWSSPLSSPWGSNLNGHSPTQFGTLLNNTANTASSPVKMLDVIQGIAADGVSTLQSATTITPATRITHVQGLRPISYIVPPWPSEPGVGGCVALIPDGAFTTNTAGNIAVSSVAVVNRVLTMCYDGGTEKWYPSY